MWDFQDEPSFESAQKNTYPEFIALLESCIKFTERYFTNQKRILVGHSAGATGVIDAFNNIAEKDEKTNINSVMLFAPWSCAEWHEYFRMTEGDYERFLGILKSILENKVYVLRAFKESNDIDSAVKQVNFIFNILI